MFRHGWPARQQDDVRSKTDVHAAGKPGVDAAWQSVVKHLERAAHDVTQGPRRALGAARDAVGRLHQGLIAAGGDASQPQRQAAFASLSASMVEKHRGREPGKVVFRGQGVQQAFGPVAEAASRPEGEADQSDSAFESEERILISEVL